MIFDAVPCYTPSDYRFKLGTSPQDLRGYYDLRRRIFCDEQHVFVSDDRDEIDRDSIPLVCTSILAGMDDAVVGVVRIDQREPGVWYGSRLGVDPRYRRVRRLSPGVQVRNHQPAYRGLGALGAGLIYKAVSTAHRLGCETFLATVQHQNARFFERLHWTPIGESVLHGIRHVHMQADLNFYPPAYEIA